MILRPFVEGDVDTYAEMLQTPEVRASLHLPDDVGREQAWNGIASWLGQWELRGTGQWAVVERSTGEFAGRAGMHWPERADWPGIEIGWAFHPRTWGKGYANGVRLELCAFRRVFRRQTREVRSRATAPGRLAAGGDVQVIGD
ncbi:MAG TPA: GNAT family N-acetyltransferase [Acidimicrobiia bacterium]|nr:GNAT family N-acetyltransferase [Acidimicrobiia bacterium]